MTVVPDDVWLSIFAFIPSPSTIAALSVTSRSFHLLARNILLYDLRWVNDEHTKANIDNWRNVYHPMNLGGLPRRICIQAPSVSPDKITFAQNVQAFNRPLYEEIHYNLTLFFNLTEISFKNALFAPQVLHSVFSTLPHLRSVSIVQCYLAPSIKPDDTPNPFTDPIYNKQLPSISSVPPFTSSGGALPLTSLVIKDIIEVIISGAMQPNDVVENQGLVFNPKSPLHILALASSTLQQLTLTWCSRLSTLASPFSPGPNTPVYPLPSLRALNLEIILFSRAVYDSLRPFLLSIPPSAAISLKIRGQNIPEIDFLHLSPLSHSSKIHTLVCPFALVPILSSTGGVRDMNIQDSPDPKSLFSKLEALSGQGSKESLRVLKVRTLRWDTEILFAVRVLFPNIEKLFVRYTEGDLKEPLLVKLSSEILPFLPSLHTLSILKDGARSIPTNVNFSQWNAHDHLTQDDLQRLEIEKHARYLEDSEAQVPSLVPEDVIDYLGGWSRYCPNLRRVVFGQTAPQAVPSNMRRRPSEDTALELEVLTDEDEDLSVIAQMSKLSVDSYGKDEARDEMNGPVPSAWSRKWAGCPWAVVDQETISDENVEW